ncbi:MAG: hypothetical protein KF780_00725 [Sphingomonas sp.]|nr:hypothetical protein [Sphingomonas sp.]
MVSPLFTALALIATGQAKVPPLPAELATPAGIRRSIDADEAETPKPDDSDRNS